MKSVGETMAIGRTFKEAFQKALRSLEIGRSGFGADGVRMDLDLLDRETIEQKMRSPNSQRMFYIKAAIKNGFTIDEVHDITGIDRWFLRAMYEIAEVEDELAALVD
jgi:carbamoyl-phosphate synthase large subunit